MVGDKVVVGGGEMVSQHNKPKTGCKKMYKKQYFNVFSVRVCTKSTEHRDGSGAKKKIK